MSTVDIEQLRRWIGRETQTDDTLSVPPAEFGRDRHPARGGFLPPVPLANRMWAGGEQSNRCDRSAPPLWQTAPLRFLYLIPPWKESVCDSPPN